MRLFVLRSAAARTLPRGPLRHLPWSQGLAVALPAVAVGAGLPHAWLAPWVLLAFAPLLALCAEFGPRKGAVLLFVAWYLGYTLLARPYLELSPLLVVAAPIVCASLYALTWIALRRLAGEHADHPAVLATAFFLVEGIKSAAGLEYGNLAYGLWPLLPVLPLVAWVGAPGLSWLVWYGNACAAAFLRKGLTARALSLRVLGVGAVLLCPTLFGSPIERSGELLVVADSWGHSARERQLQSASPTLRARTLAERLDSAKEQIPVESNADVVLLWPETALQFRPEGEGLLPDALASRGLPAGTKIVAGAFGPPTGARGLSTNTTYVFDAQGRIEDRYDKVRLIPFDEAQPLQLLSELLFDRETLMEFAPGTSLDPLDLEFARAGISICYEETFPHGFAEQVDRGAEVLFTCANYAYFTSPLAPAFIEALARFRARETGRALLRVSNGRGVDHVDRFGRVVARHGDGEARALRVETLAGETPFVTAGRHLLLPLALLLAGSATLLGRRGRSRLARGRGIEARPRPSTPLHPSSR